jgi:large subunit ribosomal protein L3
MTIGLVGKKCGMTRVFTEDGVSIPVTVIEMLSNRITQIKTADNDGYIAVQVATGVCKRSRLTKAKAGHFAKASVEPSDQLKEFYIEDIKEIEDLTVGTELKLEQFSVGQYVDVSGITKGKGFAGTIKRHHFSSQDASHGNSLSHRVPGSIGQRQSPGKVFKGKRMAGRLGGKKRTILSQQIVRIDTERNLILIKGAIPGFVSGYVIIRSAIKKRVKGEANAT